MMAHLKVMRTIYFTARMTVIQTEGADIAKILNVLSQGRIQCTVYILPIYSRNYGGPLQCVHITVELKMIQDV